MGGRTKGSLQATKSRALSPEGLTSRLLGAVGVCNPQNPRKFSTPTAPQAMLHKEDNRPNSRSSSLGLSQSWLESSRTHTNQTKGSSLVRSPRVQDPRSDVPRRSGTSGSRKENVASQIRFLSRSSIANPHSSSNVDAWKQHPPESD